MTDLLLTYAPTDVDRDLARRAHEGTSFVPHTRAEQEVMGYCSEMASIVEQMAPFATSDNIDQLRADLEAYRAEYVRRKEAHWRIRSACVSTMIAGASGFNVRRAEKANERERKALAAFLDWRRRAMDRLHKTYDPARASRVIRSDDGDAVAKLREKLADLEETQERMKAANKVCRNAKLTEAEKVAALVVLGGTEATAHALLHPAFGRPGFASYQFSNNNANIRRIRGRIAELEREAARPEADDRTVTILGVEANVIENTAENRLQLIFEDKPPSAIRDALKSRGFRWAPSQGAWQRQLNDNARAALEWLASLQEATP